MSANKLVENVSKFTKEEALEWLKDIGLSSTGSKDELINRIKRFICYPKLVKKLKNKAKRHYKFSSSLNPLEIPPSTAKWSSNHDSYPNITSEQFKSYASQKSEGSQGQQMKAVRMFQSRKIVSVRTIQGLEEGDLFVKAMIKKSYGYETRPAVLYLNNNAPSKAHCNCHVGSCGLCCHVLSLLLFLKQFNETGEKIIELTCTQQLQRWHRRSTKSSIPMAPLNEIKIKTAKLKKQTQPADPHLSLSKRDVPSIVKELNKRLDKEKNVTEHVHSVLK
eukprot:TCONS_00036004-protein